MNFNRALLPALILSCVAIACDGQNAGHAKATTVDLAAYFPIEKGSTSIFLGSKLSQKGDVIEKYEVKVGVVEVREDKDGSIVGFSRIGNPPSYSNDGPEEYLVSKEKIIDYSGDGCPLLKNTMAVDEQWEHPAGAKNATKVRVISLSSDEVLGTRKFAKCIVIRIYEPGGQRYRLMTFAPRIGLIKTQVFIGESHLTGGKADYLEVLK